MTDILDDRLQKACELRLEQAGWIYDVHENQEDLESLGVSQSDFEAAEAAMAGPYDGCDTCLVREVLDAAFDVMRQLTPAERVDFMREVWGEDDGRPNVRPISSQADLIGRL